jgi:serine/threonine protein kinase
VSSAKYSDTAKDEISLLMRARRHALKEITTRHGNAEWVEHPGSKHVVSLLDYFSTRGRYRDDSHVCMVLDPLGETLLNLLDRYRSRYGGSGELSGIPMNVVKVIAKQVLMGLQYLHDECGLVHTDIKPENIRTLPLLSIYTQMNIPGIQSSDYQIPKNTSVPSSRRHQLFLVSVS